MTGLAGSEVAAEGRTRLREILTEAGGVVGSGRSAGTAGPPPVTPFGNAEPVEGDAIAAVAVGRPLETSRDAAFADGIQRYIVEGRIGVTPIVRAHVAAAVLRRRDRVLHPMQYESEEIIVASLDRLPDRVVAALHETGFTVCDCGVGDREHPILDVQLAVQTVEERRRVAERRVVTAFRRAFPDEWLIIDGSLRSYGRPVRESRTLGVIKSHETQFFAGRDLETALTLPEGHRTTVFRRTQESDRRIFSWYVRLWDWVGKDILFGLLRLEREEGEHVIEEANDVCRWMLAERAPIAAPDGRWDRLLYPIREVETYLRAKVGSWW